MLHGNTPLLPSSTSHKLQPARLLDPKFEEEYAKPYQRPRELLDYLSVVLKRKWLILTLVLICTTRLRSIWHSSRQSTKRRRLSELSSTQITSCKPRKFSIRSQSRVLEHTDPDLAESSSDVPGGGNARSAPQPRISDRAQRAGHNRGPAAIERPGSSTRGKSQRANYQPGNATGNSSLG